MNYLRQVLQSVMLLNEELNSNSPLIRIRGARTNDNESTSSDSSDEDYCKYEKLRTKKRFRIYKRKSLKKVLM